MLSKAIIKLSTFVFLMALLCIPALASLPEPMAYYSFDQQYNNGSVVVVDSSYPQINATILGDVPGDFRYHIDTTFAKSLPNNATGCTGLELTTTEAIKTQINISPDILENRSISLWLNTSGGAQNKGILGDGDASSEYTYTLQARSDLTFRFDRPNGTIKSFGSYSNNARTHIVVTQDNTEDRVSIYLNGDLNLSNEKIYNSNGDVLLFLQTCSVDCWQLCDNANIDEVAIFDKYLNQSQVLELWNDGSGLFYPWEAEPVVNSNLYAYAPESQNTTDDFYIYGSWNYTMDGVDNGTPITNIEGQCNVTLEWSKASIDDITLNHSYASHYQDIEGIENTSKYLFVGYICHDDNQEANITILNTADNQLLSIYRNEIPLCSDSILLTLPLNSSYIDEYLLNISTDAYAENQSISISNAYIEQNTIAEYEMEYAGIWRYNAKFSYPDNMTHYVRCYYTGDSSLDKNSTSHTDINERNPEIKFTQFKLDDVFYASTQDDVFQYVEGKYNLHFLFSGYEIIYLEYILKNGNDYILEHDSITTAGESSNLMYNFSNVIAYYGFEKGSGSTAYDNSTHNNHGTIVEALYNTSKTGNMTGSYSLNFDGINDYVDIPYQSYYSFGQNKDFSVCAWVYPVNTNGSGFAMFDTRDVLHDGILFYKSSGNALSVNINSWIFQSIYSITDDSWHHVCLSVDRDSASNSGLYHNKQKATIINITASQDIQTSTNPTIGKRSFDTLANVFKGKIDNVIVFNRSITQAEVTSLYDNSITYYTQYIPPGRPYLEIDTTSINFMEIINPYNLTITAGNSELNISASLIFYFNDTVYPFTDDIKNESVAYNSTFSFNITFVDENFYGFSVVCNNSFTENITGLNVTSYTYEAEMNISMSDISCDWHYCDGHTDNKLKKEWQVMSSDNTKEFKFKINNKENKLKYMGSKKVKLSHEKKEDRIEFEIEFPEKVDNKLEDYIFYYETAGASTYIESDTYPAWINDWDSQTWFDMAGINGDISVFQLDYNLWEITVSTTSNKLKAKSTGEFNCIDTSQLLSVVLPEEELADTVMQFNTCPSTIEGVLSLGLMIALVLIVMLINWIYIRLPALTVLCGFPWFWIAYTVIACSEVIAILLAIFGIFIIFKGAVFETRVGL